MGRGVAVPDTDFPAGDGLETGPMTMVGVGRIVGNGAGDGVTRAVAAGMAGIVGVTVNVGEGSAGPGPGLSSPGTGVWAPEDTMFGAEVDSLPPEHATMATATTTVSTVPNRDLI